MSLPDLNNAAPSQPVGAPESRPSGRKPLGNLAEAQHKKLLRNAKIAIGFVGILTLGANYFVLTLIEKNSAALETQITNSRNNPNFVVDEKLVTTARNEISDAKTQTIAFMALGGIFIGCLFFINQHPVPVTMTAFILYIVGSAIGIGLNPENAGKGLFIKIIIIAALYKGMQAGQSLQKLRDEQRTA